LSVLIKLQTNATPANIDNRRKEVLSARTFQCRSIALSTKIISCITNLLNHSNEKEVQPERTKVTKKYLKSTIKVTYSTCHFTVGCGDWVII
jgi:hypothetical protein